MKILGFVGKRKSGKTTAANMFLEVAAFNGSMFRKVSFADELRRSFAEKRGIDPDLLLQNFAKEEYREDLIKYAIEIRKTDPLYFVKSLFDNILEYENIIIDDVRYIEELEAIWNRKGVIYKVEAETKVLESRGWKYTLGVDDDLGETELGSLSPHTFLPYGGFIYNNKGKEPLKSDLIKLYDKHFKGT